MLLENVINEVDIVDSVFEIKKITKNGFDLLNLVNEKLYTALCNEKITKYRGVIPGQYLVGDISKDQDKYYLSKIDAIYPSKAKLEIYRAIVMQQLENPELLYKDNDNKLAEIEKMVKDLNKKFKKYFKKDEIITQSNYVDELLGNFNDYIENNDLSIQADIDALISLPEKFGYFEIKDTEGKSVDPISSAFKGFSAYEKHYDVGIIFDKDSGLLVLPFYGTFKEIFVAEDYKAIEGYKECVSVYFNNDKISPEPILRAYNQNKENFIKIASEILEINEDLDIDQLLYKYKEEYFTKKKFSALLIMYSSKVFNELMEMTNIENSNINLNKIPKVGRNDACPCGSGKKYKKCCIS